MTDPVLDAASIGVDQTPGDAAWKSFSDALLPRLQSNVPIVLQAKAVLRK